MVIDSTIARWKGEGITPRDLMKIHEKLIKVNPQGADRFSVYAFLIIMCYEWPERLETEDYIKRNGNQRMIREYITKVKECVH